MPPSAIARPASAASPTNADYLALLARGLEIARTLGPAAAQVWEEVSELLKKEPPILDLSPADPADARSKAARGAGIVNQHEAEREARLRLGMSLDAPPDSTDPADPEGDTE